MHTSTHTFALSNFLHYIISYNPTTVKAIILIQFLLILLAAASLRNVPQNLSILSVLFESEYSFRLRQYNLPDIPFPQSDIHFSFRSSVRTTSRCAVACRYGVVYAQKRRAIIGEIFRGARSLLCVPC